jgi:hypothetical protein
VYPPGVARAVTLRISAAAASLVRIRDLAPGSGHLTRELNAMVGLRNVHRLQQRYDDAAADCYDPCPVLTRC